MRQTFRLALGAGLRKPAALAEDTGIRINHLGKYLATLLNLRLVRRARKEGVMLFAGAELQRVGT